MSNYPISEDINGQPTMGLRDPRHYSQGWRNVVADEVNGDAVANGTLIGVIEVTAGHVLYIHDVTVVSKVGAKTFRLIQCSTAIVTGVQTIRKVYDLGGAGMLIDKSPMGPVCIIDNSAGVASVWAMLMMPQARAGGAANNAVGQFVGGSISGVLE